MRAMFLESRRYLVCQPSKRGGSYPSGKSKTEDLAVTYVSAKIRRITERSGLWVGGCDGVPTPFVGGHVQA